MSLLDTTSEQRKSARTWALIGSGPAVLAVVILIIVVLVWKLPGEAALRINWLGWIALALAGLLAIAQITYAVDQALRYFKFGASSEGVTIEATGHDADAPVEDAPK